MLLIEQLEFKMLKSPLIIFLMISFWFVSCSSSDEESSSATSVTRPTSFSGDTASGTISVESDSLTGTYKTVCAATTSMTSYPTDATYVGFVIIVKSSTSFTKEINYYTDSDCTSLSLGWYFNYDTFSSNGTYGSDYMYSTNLASYDVMANTTAAETYIESIFGDLLDVTVGTESTLTMGVTYYNLVNISGTTLSFGTESESGYPSSSGAVSYEKQ